MSINFYDLNTSNYLTHWKIEDALREIISNAIDESVITQTDKPEIIYDEEDNILTIRDRGRGMRVEHLIQNENDEKKCNSKLIGRFGIGLKDAISCLNDNGKTITIESKYLYIKQIKKLSKKGFNNIKTCHLGIEKEKDKKFIGTLIQIHDIEPEEYENVVNMFVSLMDLNLICKTNFGNIYKKHDSKIRDLFS